MRITRMIGALAVAAVATAGCEEITNPVEEAGTFAPPYVQFDDVEANGPHESTNAVVFEAPPRPEEDVEIDFTFGGDAVFGEDFQVVNADGSVRSDVDADGGTVTISGDPTLEESHDTMWIFIPGDAEVGRVIEVQITSASTADGDSVIVGRLGDNATFELTITAAPAEIPTGTYAGALSGGLAGGTTVTIAESEGDFDYEISDIAAGAFGVPVAWEFSVLSDGTTQWSDTPRDFTLAQLAMTGGITGTFDFTTTTLTWDVQYTDTFDWTGTVTLQ